MTVVIRPGVLISRPELMKKPMKGPAWTALLKVANASMGTANLSEMNDGSELKVVAAAMAGVRLDDAALIAKASKALDGAIGTEESIRWLEIGRNLLGWIVVTDLLPAPSARAKAWILSYMTRLLPDNNSQGQDTIRQSAWSSGSNASAQVGAVHAGLSVHLNDPASLAWSWEGFRRYVGDRASTWKMKSNNDAWQEHPEDVVGIQNMGAKAKNGINIDGAISNDMWRSNPKPVADLIWMKYSNYPWVGLNGATLAAEIFYRQGYPAYEIENQAIKRAAIYLNGLSAKDKGWYDGSTRKDAKYIIDKRCGLQFPCTLPVGANGLVGFSDFWLT